jgi:adenylyl cyclase-associated protein
VDSILASLDVVNCKSVQLQILGKSPTAIVDKTDGLQLYLSRECLDIEIFTAKSSELNVSIPSANNTDDFVERPIPEQFKTVVTKDGVAHTMVVEHKG